MFRPTEPRAPIAAEPIDDEIIDFIGSRQFLDVRIPRTPYKGKLRLVARAELFAIKAAARKFFLEHDMPLDNHAAFGGEEWSNELAVRMLAVAVRNPRDPQL
ncbi:MAG TPA: hypothetical protein VN253_30275, partial [Kofleriaceae bacterium]|nr:hypothetical protein [Kofleriaceae bacterium]